jgi:hypothetical protein
MNATVATTGSANKKANPRVVKPANTYAMVLGNRTIIVHNTQAPPSPPQRTKSRAFPSTIYDMPFEAFVEHLRTIYNNDEVDMMVNGLKLIDSSGCQPVWTWPEPAPRTTSKPTANGKHSFTDDLDEEDFADTTERPDLEG